MNTAVISANTGYLNLKIGFASTYENQSDLLIDTFIFFKSVFQPLTKICVGYIFALRDLNISNPPGGRK